MRHLGIYSILLSSFVFLSQSSADGPDKLPSTETVIAVQQKIPTEVLPDSVVPIELKLKNISLETVENVVLSDVLSPGYEFVDANPVPAQLRGNLSWFLGKMDPGEEKVIVLRVRTAKDLVEPQFKHTVDVAYQKRIQNTAIAKVLRIEPEIKVALPKVSVVGVPVKLELQLRNPSTVAMKDLIVQLKLPEGITHPSGDDLENVVGTIEPGQSKMVSLVVNPIKPGDHTIRLKTQGKMTKAVDMPIALHVDANRITAAMEGAKQLKLQQSGLYELVLANEGGQTVKGVTVKIALPEHLHFVRATDQGIYDKVTHTIIWQIPELQVGEKRAVVWHGSGQKVGDGEVKLRCQIDQQDHTQSSWAIRVVANESSNRE
jgi:hypothetical protein